VCSMKKSTFANAKAWTVAGLVGRDRSCDVGERDYTCTFREHCAHCSIYRSASGAGLTYKGAMNKLYLNSDRIFLAHFSKLEKYTHVDLPIIDVTPVTDAHDVRFP
jgi:hypothetical protein